MEFLVGKIDAFKNPYIILSFLKFKICVHLYKMTIQNFQIWIFSFGIDELLLLNYLVILRFEKIQRKWIYEDVIMS